MKESGTGKRITLCTVTLLYYTEVMRMKAGFIGAGKVGFSLGKYLKEGGVPVPGYFSRSRESAMEAAGFTDTGYYDNLADIAKDSDTLFITVPDGTIGAVWENLRNLPIKDKNICHCSGSLSSAAFFDAEEKGAFAYSVHPLYAVSDKKSSYRGLADAYFTIEGSAENLEDMKECFQRLGNKVITMPRDKKALYHCAAVTVSNHIAALADMGVEMLVDCGFDHESAERALAPLIRGNAISVAELGASAALTGPVERGDHKTIEAHLKVLESFSIKQENIYRLLSERLADIAERKHPDRDYSKLREIVTENL